MGKYRVYSLGFGTMGAFDDHDEAVKVAEMYHAEENILVNIEIVATGVITWQKRPCDKPVKK